MPHRGCASRSAATPVAPSPPLWATAAFAALRWPKVHQPSIVVTSSIHSVSTIALGLHRDGRLGRVGAFALHAGGTPRRVEHFEHPFVHRPGPGVGRTRAIRSQIARRLKLYRQSYSSTL
jgi:hypothetical protein